jgi:hypothetical protein
MGDNMTMNGRAIFLVSSMLIAAAVLAIPQSALNSDTFLQASRATTFPVRIHDNLVYIPTQIAGRDLWFVLDSGSSRTLLDRSLATALGLKVEGAGSIQGAGAGRIPIQSVRNVDIHFPGIESAYSEISTIDLKGASQEVVRSADGILGYDFLSRFVVTVDYEHKTVTVQAPETFVPPSEARAIPITFDGKWPIAQGELLLSNDVVVQDHFLVDSGSGDAVDHPAVKSMESKQQTTTGVGLGTPGTGYQGVLWGFRWGGLTWHDVPTACCGATEETSRLIGGEILRRFTVTFDYPHSRILLRANGEFNSHFN